MPFPRGGRIVQLAMRVAHGAASCNIKPADRAAARPFFAAWRLAQSLESMAQAQYGSMRKD
jgi:hypothetical protein